MTTAELNKKLKEIGDKLEITSPTDDSWDALYAEYFELEAQLDEIYRKENEPKLIAFYEKHIKGKKFSEVEPEAWSFYSDWHKDVYGYRPRHT